MIFICQVVSNISFIRYLEIGMKWGEGSKRKKVNGGMGKRAGRLLTKLKFLGGIWTQS